jgi:putative tricarboxylic transport membrane protein
VDRSTFRGDVADAARHPLPPAPPRSDLVAAAAVFAVALATAIAAWRMDRLESQGGTLWTAPGLWPGIVALVLAALAAALAVRARRRAGALGWHAAIADDTPRVATSRFVLAAALFFVYALLLVGRGLPFWLGTGLFVAAYVLIFHDTPARPLARRLLLAAVVGVATSLVVTLVFERVFLVRLP